MKAPNAIGVSAAPPRLSAPSNKELTRDGASPGGHCASVGAGQAYASLLLPWTMNLRISKPRALLGTQLQKTESTHSQSMLCHCPPGVRC